MRIQILAQDGELVGLHRPPDFCVIPHARGKDDCAIGDENRNQQKKTSFHSDSVLAEFGSLEKKRKLAAQPRAIRDFLVLLVMG